MSRIEWKGEQYLAALRGGLDDGVNAYGLVVERETGRALNKGGGAPLSPSYRPSRPGRPPHLMSGQLRRSITLQRSTGGMATAYVGTNVRYAKGLEQGITISAKRTKYLPIPLSANARRIQRNLSGRSLRTRKDLRVVKIKDGRLFLVRDRGPGEPPEFLFKLQSTVRIAPRPFLRPSLRKSRTAGQAAFARAVAAGVRRRMGVA